MAYVMYPLTMGSSPRGRGKLRYSPRAVSAVAAHPRVGGENLLILLV